LNTIIDIKKKKAIRTFFLKIYRIKKFFQFFFKNKIIFFILLQYIRFSESQAGINSMDKNQETNFI
jgi:hypothetical protein